MSWLTVLSWLRKPWVLLAIACGILFTYNTYLRYVVNRYEEKALVEKALRQTEKTQGEARVAAATAKYDRELAVLRAASYPSGPLRLYVSAPLRISEVIVGPGEGSPADVPIPVREADRVSRDIGPDARALMDEADELALRYNQLLHSCAPEVEDDA